MSSTEGTSDLTRKQRRDQARDQRRAAEVAAASAAARRRRMLQLGGVLAVVVAALVIAIVVSSGGATKVHKLTASQTGGAVPDASLVSQTLSGIPQNGTTLGNPNAKVTLVWFGDLQCPVCKEFHGAVFQPLVTNFVRTGKVKLVWEGLNFIGPDSTKAAQVAGAAAAQNKLWNFISLFYYNQQEENSGYVTDQFLRQIASGAGLNVTAAMTQRFSPAAAAQIAKANQLANQALNPVQTPSFLIGKTGGGLKVLSYSSLSYPAFSGPLTQVYDS